MEKSSGDSFDRTAIDLRVLSRVLLSLDCESGCPVVVREADVTEWPAKFLFHRRIPPASPSDFS
jgi:hypothetical protein